MKRFLKVVHSADSENWREYPLMVRADKSLLRGFPADAFEEKMYCKNLASISRVDVMATVNSS
jgi:hypothetical protein